MEEEWVLAIVIGLLLGLGYYLWVVVSVLLSYMNDPIDYEIESGRRKRLAFKEEVCRREPRTLI